MTYLHRITHALVIASLLVSVLVTPADAAPADDLNPTINEVFQGQFSNMSYQTVLSFTGSVENQSTTESYDVYFEVGLGALWPDSSWVTVNPGDTVELGLSIAQSDFPEAQFCVNGLVDVTINIWADPEIFLLGTGSSTFLCSLAGESPTPVSIPTPFITAELCGPDNDEWSPGELPVGIAGYYDDGWAENSIFITYVAADGYVIDGDDRARLYDNNVPCDVSVSPLPPSVDAVCGDNNDEILLTEQPVGIGDVAQEGWFDNSYWITYFPQAGYVIPEGADTFEIIDKGDCATMAPLPPIVTAVCGDNNDEIVLVEQPEGIGEATEGGWLDNAYVISYVPLEGYFIPEGAETIVITDSGACETPVATEPVTPVATVPPVIPPVATVTVPPALPPAAVPKETPVATTPPSAPPKEVPVASVPAAEPPVQAPSVPVPPDPGTTNPDTSAPASPLPPPASAPQQPPTPTPPPGPPETMEERIERMKKAREEAQKKSEDAKQALKEKLDRLKQEKEASKEKLSEAARKAKEDAERAKKAKDDAEKGKNEPKSEVKNGDGRIKIVKDAGPGGREPILCGDSGVMGEKVRVLDGEKSMDACAFLEPTSGQKLILIPGNITVIPGAGLTEVVRGSGGDGASKDVGGSGGDGGSTGLVGTGGDGGSSDTGGSGGDGGSTGLVGTGGDGGSSDTGGSGGGGGAAGVLVGNGGTGGAGGSGGDGGSAGIFVGDGGTGGDGGSSGAVGAGGNGGQPFISLLNGGVRIIGQPNGSTGPVLINGAPVSIFTGTASLQSAAPYGASVVDDEGTIDLQGLPVGEYRLVIHPKDGEDIEFDVRVVAPQIVTGLPTTGAGTGIVPANRAPYIASAIALAAVSGWLHRRGVSVPT